MHLLVDSTAASKKQQKSRIVGKKYAKFFVIKEICSTFAALFAISGKKFRRESIRVACEYCEV